MSDALAEALARLDDYTRGYGDEDNQHDYEESLFERALANEAPELGFRAGLGKSLRHMHARGVLDLWLTSTQVEKLLQQMGSRAAFYVLDLANPMPPQIPAEAEIFVTQVKLDLSDVRSLEAEVLDDDGRVLKRMPDVAFDSEKSAIYACCEADLARAAASSARLTRLWATGESGGRRLLVELRV